MSTVENEKPMKTMKEEKKEEDSEQKEESDDKKADEKKAVPDNDAVSALMALASTAEKDDSSGVGSDGKEESDKTSPTSPETKDGSSPQSTSAAKSINAIPSFPSASSNARFPSKLMAILSNDEYKNIVSWSADGQSFLFHDRKGFETVVLPTIFKDSKFDSFLRKLYRWGFSKCQVHSKVGCPAYKHEKFFRDHPELCTQMECRSKPKSQPKGGPSAMALNSWHASMQGSFPMAGMPMGMGMGLGMGMGMNAMGGMGMNAMGGMGMNAMGMNGMGPHATQASLLSSLKNGTQGNGMLRPDLLMPPGAPMNMNMASMVGAAARNDTSTASNSLKQYISNHRDQHQRIMNSAAQVFQQQGQQNKPNQTSAPGSSGGGANGGPNSSGSSSSASQQPFFNPNPANPSAMLGMNHPPGVGGVPQFSPTSFPGAMGTQMRAMRLFQMEQEIAQERAQAQQALNQVIDHNQMRGRMK